MSISEDILRVRNILMSIHDHRTGEGSSRYTLTEVEMAALRDCVRTLQEMQPVFKCERCGVVGDHGCKANVCGWCWGIVAPSEPKEGK